MAAVSGLDRGGYPGPATGVVAAALEVPVRRGSRFWALAGPDSDVSDGDDDRSEDCGSPTPSDCVCESLLLGRSEEQIAEGIEDLVPPSDVAWKGLAGDDRVEVVRRVVHRRTAPTAVKPWKGPLPKVIFRATSWIRTWSLLSHADSRELMAIGCNRWEMAARVIFNRFGWHANNRLDFTCSTQ